MRLWARVRMLGRSVFGRGRAEAELADEMRDHLEQEIESNVRAGMPRREAMAAARRLTGSIELYKDECRDARGTLFIENCVRDVRYGVQMLRRTPLFTVAAIVTLALVLARTRRFLRSSRMWCCGRCRSTSPSSFSR